MDIGLSKINRINSLVVNVSTESQFNTEIEYSIACEQLEACLKAGDELTRIIENVYELQAVADKYQSAEALNVIHAITDGQLMTYSTEGFLSKTWEKIKKFFKTIWEKITAFFKWIWNKIKTLLGVKAKVRCSKSSSLAKIAQHNKKVADSIIVQDDSKENYSTEVIINAIAISALTVTAIYTIISNFIDNGDRMEHAVEYSSALDDLADLLEKFKSFLADSFNNYYKSENVTESQAKEVGSRVDELVKTAKSIKPKKRYCAYYSFYRDHVRLLMKLTDQIHTLDDEFSKKLRDILSNVNKHDTNGVDDSVVRSYNYKVSVVAACSTVCSLMNKALTRSYFDIREAAPKLFDANELAYKSHSKLTNKLIDIGRISL